MRSRPDARPLRLDHRFGVAAGAQPDCNRPESRPFASRGRRVSGLPLPLVSFCLIGSALPADAFIVDISPGPTAVYLQVGNGSFSGFYGSGGTPLENGTVNRVSLTVPAAVLGNGTDQSMTSNSTQAGSFYDGFTFCNPPTEVYVGGFYRRPNSANQSAVLSVQVPAALTSAASDSISFAQIRWTSSGNGDGTAAQPIPAGTFVAGSTQFLANFLRNTWRESCLTFYYLNDQIVPAGSYTGRVVYTLATP